MTKKANKKSLLTPMGYEDSFDEILQATKKATDSERKHAWKLGGFLMNGFVYIARHLINMMSESGADMGLEELDRKTMKSKGVKRIKGLGGNSQATERERLSMLVGFFVAFVYECLSPAIEIQDKYGRTCSVDTDKLAYDLGIIKDGETFNIGAPEVSADGNGVQVPVGIGTKADYEKEGKSANRDKLEKLLGEDGIKELDALMSDDKIREQLRQMMIGGHGKGADA